MSDNKQLQTAWQCWHAGTGIDTEDMPPANPSFKAGFDYGMVAAHNEHCAALIRVEELSSDAKKMAAIIGIKDVLVHRLTEKVEELKKALEVAHAANRTSDAAFTRIIERSGLSDAHTLADLADYVCHQADIIDTCNATISALEAENKALRGTDNGFE